MTAAQTTPLAPLSMPEALRFLSHPLGIALAGFGAGFSMAMLLPVGRLDSAFFASARAHASATLRQLASEAAEVARQTLAPPPQDEVQGDRVASVAAEQPEHPYDALPREFPYEEPVALLRRLSLHDRDEEEPIVDLRNDVVGDEHPF